MRNIVIFLLAVWPVLAGAVTFDEYTRSLPLGQDMYVFEDVRGDSTINDIASPALQGSFRRHDKPVLNAGYSRSVFWLRLDLEYRPQSLGGQQPWLLELAYPPLDHLELYQDDGQGNFQLIQRTGDALPFSSRQIKQNNYL
ncbi:MAG TPA: 7TM-DISM domain-containing protein, partial [Pseudomonas sp.]|nr:7TM-DISM domain-containing protein [Pseudomonas sp.]